jgi:uncharacterized protein YjaZ
MKKNSNVSLIIALFLKMATAYGQGGSDKIIFLTDLYTTFINKVEADNKNVDKIYQENIHALICNNYFKKSEYADIVSGFLMVPVKDMTGLRNSVERIVSNKEIIDTKIKEALKMCKQTLPNDSLTIYVIPANSDYKQILMAMSGIMGLTAGSKQIILTIEPGIPGWENMLEYAVAHEYNHAYWTKMNFGQSAHWTLLDYLVFEGRGDYFAHLLYPAIKAPWTMALSEKMKPDLWNKVKPRLQDEDFNFQREVMFGSANYPNWGGYSLGYDIVVTALTNDKKLKMEEWINLDPEKILMLSNYKFNK